MPTKDQSTVSTFKNVALSLSKTLRRIVASSLWALLLNEGFLSLEIRLYTYGVCIIQMI